MVGYKETLNLLSKAIGGLFNRDIGFFDTDELNVSVAFIDDCIKKIKEHQAQTMMKDLSKDKKLTAFYTMFSAESDGIKYIVEIGSVPIDNSFQYIISVKDPNVVCIRRKLISRGSISYRSEFGPDNKIACLTRVHRLDGKRTYL